MTKRAHGEGSVYRRKSDGRWTGALPVTLPDGTKKRHYVYGDTKAEAAELLSEARHARDRGMLPTGEKQTVEQFLTSWLRDSADPVLRKTSFAAYQSLLTYHILPALGHIQLQKLTPQDIRRLYSQMIREKLQPATIRIVHAILSTALKQAAQWDMVSRNVAKMVSPPRIEAHQMRPLSIPESKQFIAAARGHRYEGLFILAVGTGMRKGEILALRWTDVDLKTGHLQVRRTVTRRGEKEGGFIENEPKTKASRRRIVLPSFVVAALEKQRQRQDDLKVKAGERWEQKGQHDLVFSNRYGDYVNSRNLVEEFRKVLTKAELPRIRFHDLRHTCATTLLTLNAHPKVVQELLGHSSILVTLNLYSHVLPSVHEEAMKKLDTAYGQE